MTPAARVLAGLLLGGAVTVLSACAAAPRDSRDVAGPASAAAPAAMIQAPSTRGEAVVQGALIYREPVVLPPEAMARVQLVRLGPDRVPRGVLSTAWVAGPMAPPVPFRLTWNPRGVPPLAADERLAVVAMVMVADEVLFTSLAPAAYVSAAEPVVVPLLARWGGVEV